MEAQPELKFMKLSEHGKTPSRGTSASAGLDIFSAEQCLILPYTKAKIHTDIAIEAPPMTYLRIAPKSSLALKYSIDVLGGVIDSGNLFRTRKESCGLLFC